MKVRAFLSPKKKRALKNSHSFTLFWDLKNFDLGPKKTNLNNMRACFVYMRVKPPPNVCGREVQFILQSEN